MSLRVGVDLGATKIQTLVVAADGGVAGRHRAASPAAGGPAAVLKTVAKSIRRALASADTAPDDLTAIGIGAPGQVDTVTGVVLYATNLEGWGQPVPVADVLRAEFGVPVVLANDVQASVVGEHRLGAGSDSNSMLGIFCGTGVGGGVIIGGRLWTGRGSAGEIGHTVVWPGGDLCGCGRRGCLEAYAGRLSLEQRARQEQEQGRPTVLFDLMQEQGRKRLTSRVWADALAQHDELAMHLIEQAMRAIGIAAGSAANLLDIDCIVIGGGLATRLGEPFVEGIRIAAEPIMLRVECAREIRLSTLGDDCGALGAALIATDRVAAADLPPS